MNKILFEIAKNELNTSEVVGSGNNPRIVEYHSTTSLKALDDETPWCASFMNWVLKQAGIIGTNSAWARSFLDCGCEVHPENAIEGDIVVLSRGSNSQTGHVAFFCRWQPNNLVTLLGGNQNDKVCFKNYSSEHILNIRRLCG